MTSFLGSPLDYFFNIEKQCQIIGAHLFIHVRRDIVPKFSLTLAYCPCFRYKFYLMAIVGQLTVIFNTRGDNLAKILFYMYSLLKNHILHCLRTHNFIDIRC